MSEFIYQYNSSDNPNKSNASSIEHEAIVYLTFKNEYAYYLDFDENNGYLIVDSNYCFQEFEVEGDLIFLKEIDYTFYNALDKFMYYDHEHNTYIPFEVSEFDDSLLISGFSADAASSSDGQYSDTTGEGQIYDLDAYVAQNYSKYSKQSIQIIPNYKWIYQYDTSIFK